MMNVPATNVDIVEGANLVKIDVGERSGDRKDDEKSDSREEEPALRPIGNVFMKQLTDARMPKHQERDDCRNRHKEQKEPRFNEHVLLEPREPSA